MEDITLGELLLSLLLTLILYGAFPLIFAGARKNSISGKKYGAWCWCVNFVLGTVCAVAVGSSTAGGYFLWTFVFWTLGKKNLAKKGLIASDDESNGALKVEENELAKCNTHDDYVMYFKEKYQNETDKKLNKILSSSSYTDATKQAVQMILSERSNSVSTPTDSNQRYEQKGAQVDLNSEKQPYMENNLLPQIKYCRICGKLLRDDSNFCVFCGTQIMRGDKND